jgi:hypothetical protein
MHRLNKDVDVSFLLNREVIQLCIGLYQAILRFDGGVEISLECEFRLVPDPGLAAKKDAAQSRYLNLASLLGCRVSQIENPGNGSIWMFFSDRSTLEIVDSNRDRESFQITHESRVIVV